MSNRKRIARANHALMPKRLYARLIRMAFSMAFDEEDLGILVWLIKEKLVRKQEVEIAEYRLMRKSKALQEMRKQPCAICGKPSGTIDHIVPLARGGTNEPSNLRPLCFTCNSKKSDKEDI